MCGIAGFVDFESKLELQDLKSMTDALNHRGPDSGGYAIHQTPNANIGLGHRRLSIIDLSANANQPMSKSDVEIVFNGEIYNYKELREDLLKKGHQFENDSDTEVLLTGYLEYGLDFLNQ